MAECIAAGLGEGRLPCFVGDAHPKLTRVGAVEKTSIGLWLLSPEALRKSARVQATRARLVECLTPELRPLLRGVAARHRMRARLSDQLPSAALAVS
jgi:hypothetical protein